MRRAPPAKFTEGAKLDIQKSPRRDARPMNFGPTVLAVQRERELRWLGSFLLPASSTASTASTSTRSATAGPAFRASDFSGILVPAFKGALTRPSAAFGR
jgi:hypothetical protein